MKLNLTLALLIGCAAGCAWLRPPKDAAGVNRGQLPPPAMMGTGSEPGYRPDTAPKAR